MLPLNKRTGFTLLEVLVALVILMVGMMALLSAANNAISFNMDNILRDEAVQIADAKMRVVKANNAATFSLPFQNLSIVSIQQSKLGSKSTPYTVTLSSSTTGGDSNLIQVLVSWNYKNKLKKHELSTLKTY
ncbi:MAG: prepilin-type N-terminal cleavage/methylation domain-containing protein [Geobacteraceae bacterium]|nr:prepilin-type N-terminal cleavage/methylation domain-containing protein [Geobacteraceae bacterium]